MKVLGIDTTRKSAILYIYDSDTDLKYSLRMSESIKHSEGLFLYIEKALFECKMKISDFDIFCGVVGPGSFTGIRVGMSVLKGFNEVQNKRLLPLNTFEIIASKYKKGCCLLNSTTTSCYYAKLKSHEIIETGVVLKNELSTFLEGGEAIILSDEQDSINIEYNNIEVENNIEELFFKCLISKINNENFDEFLPYYLQLSQAERSKYSE